MDRKKQRTRIVWSFIVMICMLFCGCNNTDWAFRNRGGTVQGKRTQPGVDIGLCGVDVKASCVIAVIDSGFTRETDEKNYTEVEINALQADTHAAEIVYIIETLIAGSISDAETIKVIQICIDPSEMNPDNINEAIKYAEERGARIVNCSWSVNWQSDDVEEIIRNSSMLFVCAAGNQQKEMCEYPAVLSTKLDNVISVGGLNCEGALAGSSNYGSGVDIVAPAESILIKTDSNESYFVNGTSYAAAFVTGVAGVCLAACPDCSAAELKNALITSAEHSTLLNGYIKCAGYVSMKNTIDYLMKTGF
jgi:hypothetical protein